MTNKQKYCEMDAPHDAPVTYKILQEGMLPGISSTDAQKKLNTLLQEPL